jgi:hypothetical protein
MLTVTPATTGTFYTRTGAPLLAWNVTGTVATVEVSGPAVTARGAEGAVLATTTATLRIV